MIKLDLYKTTIIDAFGITPQDIADVERVAGGFMKTDSSITISRILRSLWLNETLSDNVKCWAIFELGRWYGANEEREECGT